MAGADELLQLLGVHRLSEDPMGVGVSPAWGKVVLVGLLLMGLVFAYTVSMRLKKVWLTADGLRVSSYLSEASIMWPHIRRVSIHDTFGHRRTPLVELELWARHPFGGRISLFPASEDLLVKLTGRAAAVHVKVEQRSAASASPN